MANVVEKTEKKQQEAPGARRFPSTFDLFDRFMDDDFPSLWSRRRMPFGELMHFENKLPSVDVIDRDNEVIIRAEIPGVDKKDLDVTMDDHSITIKGEKTQMKVNEKDDYFRKEIVEGKFARSIALPAGVQGDVVKATFKDGLLELRLTKAETEKRRHIKIE